MSLKGYIRKRLNYYFICPGIAFDHNLLMILDNEYYLYRIEHPPSSLFIVPKNSPKLDFERVRFYADCLAYLHDVPFNIGSRKKKSLIKTISNHVSTQTDTDIYYRTVEEIYSCLVDLRLNGYVWFKWIDAFGTNFNFDLHSYYKAARKEIQLYSMALKQSDPLTEFLCYYRIIESISENNGKAWISENINRIRDFDFGFIQFEKVTENPQGVMRRKNLFSYYRRRALNKIKQLNADSTIGSIECYLYNDLRCGIAHGNHHLRVYDYSLHLKDISESIFIVKLLARIAVEGKI